jgi:uncharacterized delta-60 repeat protein
MKMPIDLFRRWLLAGMVLVLSFGRASSQPGSFAPGFQPELDGGWVSALALQRDGKILAAGIYLHPGSGSGLVRLNSDGAVDETFRSPVLAFNEDYGLGGILWSVAVQHDGRILAGGRVRLAIDDYQERTTGVARLNEDGSVDESFNSQAPVGDVFAIVVQPDHKILVSGGPFEAGFAASNHVVRLNRDGSLDMSFNPRAGEDESVYAIALQRDKKVVIGGAFTTVQGVAQRGLARLNEDGSLDSDYRPLLEGNLGFLPGAFVAATGVYAVALQQNGKLLIGGNFTAVNGAARKGIARLNVDGSVDASFHPGLGADAPVVALALQHDGKVLLGGEFTTVNGLTRGRVCRLNPDGSVDVTFLPNVPPAWTRALAIERRDTVLLGGLFYFDGNPVSIVRLQLGKTPGSMKDLEPE